MANCMYLLKVRAEFTEEVLGTGSNNPDIQKEFIASKAGDDAKMLEEVDAVSAEELAEKSMTVFSRNEDGKPILWDYQIKGFFKDSTGALRKVPGTKASKVKAYKKEIDGLVFPSPRKIVIELPDGADIGDCQRPLRASTAQGERIALANSETAPEGSTIEFEVLCMTKVMLDLVKECLNYGRFRGIGCWRNSGKGAFEWQEVSCEEIPLEV